MFLFKVYNYTEKRGYARIKYVVAETADIAMNTAYKPGVIAQQTDEICSKKNILSSEKNLADSSQAVQHLKAVIVAHIVKLENVGFEGLTVSQADELADGLRQKLSAVE